MDRVGLALDLCQRLDVEIVCDAAFQVWVSVADLLEVFRTASLVVSDLTDLEMTDWARAALWRGGIGTVAQLVTRTRTELLAVQGLGPNRLNEIETALQLIGKELAQEPAARAGGRKRGNA
jgi:DNA-directed RNA polymerase alpha subunit